MATPYYKSTYQKNEAGAYQIEVALNSYQDIFDNWDPSPFKKRDIDEDFIEFLWDSAEDIPIRESLIILLKIDEPQRQNQKEMQIRTAILSHFNYLLHKSQRAFKKIQVESLMYLLFGICLFFIVYANIFNAESLLGHILEDGLFVGAWVFMWEAFSNFFIESRSIRHDLRIIKRFINSPVQFTSINQ